jgi:hypothetical protein
MEGAGSVGDAAADRNAKRVPFLINRAGDLIKKGTTTA